MQKLVTICPLSLLKHTYKDVLTLLPGHPANWQRWGRPASVMFVADFQAFLSCGERRGWQIRDSTRSISNVQPARIDQTVSSIYLTTRIYRSIYRTICSRLSIACYIDMRRNVNWPRWRAVRAHPKQLRCRCGRTRHRCLLIRISEQLMLIVS